MTLKERILSLSDNRALKIILMTEQCDDLLILSLSDFYHKTWKDFKELKAISRKDSSQFHQHNFSTVMSIKHE